MVLYFVSSNINLIQMIVVVAMAVAATAAAAAMPDIKCATHDYSLMDRG